MPEEFDNEIGEETEEGTEVVESEAEAEETEEAPPAPPKAKTVPLSELQAERQSRQRVEQELHALRMQAAQFQFQNQKQQQAVLDPQMDELRKILKPIMDAEFEPERQRLKAFEESLQLQQQVVQADTNIRIIQNELGSDWDAARPLMTEYLESRSERTRNAVLENPDLFIEKARELLASSRNTGSKVVKAALKSKAKHESGDSPRQKPSGLDPATASDKEFNAYLRSRGIL
jgi:hypothetical protein